MHSRSDILKSDLDITINCNGGGILVFVPLGCSIHLICTALT